MTGGSNSIHPTAQLSGDVVLGEGNTIGPFVVITGPVTIGDDNWFGAGVVIGAPPEVRSWPHPRADAPSDGNGVAIGSGNVIREYAQVHQGWHDVTTIGDRAFIMNQSYVAHDCRLGDDVTLASSVLLAGHVRIADGANLGLAVAVHQRRYVGRGAMVGMGAVVTHDVPPWAKAFGNPARVRGANSIGMERAGIPADAIREVATAYEAGADSPEAFSHPALAVASSEWTGRPGRAS
ncbi:acyl-ACP--UDP-N- acetylglucosamine O-acyltransferase [Leifsonia sp. AG29]|uniref:acyl-ACP--UDP-N- acetylglucosamine O-acyltransferase n=1 Tax=Leifsonia sp. AG29 TaxID=2598860 RepID=UPI00131AF2C5|nr:acyl-ACP--UDP-N- acetylglucosamine O-acyltransferase [Leifsonia sp. AG29]